VNLSDDLEATRGPEMQETPTESSVYIRVCGGDVRTKQRLDAASTSEASSPRPRAVRRRPPSPTTCAWHRLVHLPWVQAAALAPR